MKTSTKNNGSTLAEVMLTLAIITITSTLFVNGVKLVNYMFRQQSLIEVQRGGQIFLYQLTQEIRNADTIIEINGNTAGPEVLEDISTAKELDLASQTLTIRSFNYAGKSLDITDLDADGKPINDDLFQSKNIIFIRYSFDPDTKSVLRQVRESTIGGKLLSEKRFLTGLIEPDKNENRLFQPLGALSQLPFQALTIKFRVIPNWAKSNPSIYSAEAMIRGR